LVKDILLGGWNLAIVDVMMAKPILIVFGSGTDGGQIST